MYKNYEGWNTQKKFLVEEVDEPPQKNEQGLAN